MVARTLGPAFALIGCATPSPGVPAGAPVAMPPYPGVTACGPAAPPPIERRESPPMPEREPVPSFIVPRQPVAGALVEGDLSADVVDAAIRARATMLRACILRYPPHTGRIGMRFTILEDGTVADVEIRGTVAATDGCICGVIAGIRYPDLGARASVTYPIIVDGS